MKSFLQNSENPYLSELCQIIGDLTKFPSNYDFRERKLASLLKAFIKKTPYLFLENPEKHLQESDIAFLKKLMSYEANDGREIFLTTDNFAEFETIISDIVSKDNQSSFSVRAVEKQLADVPESVLKFHIDDFKKTA